MPSVEVVTAYDDLDTPHDMRTSAASVDRAPCLGSGVRFEQCPRDLAKTRIDVTKAVAVLAAAFDRG